MTRTKMIMKKLLYIYAITAVVLTSCTDDVMDSSAFLNGKEKTPIAVSLNVDNKTPQSRALSRAVNGSFETNDQLVAYFRHVKKTSTDPDPVTYEVVKSGKTGTPDLARLVNFKVSALTTDHYGKADNYTNHNESSTLTCTDAQGLYWDDFSEGGKGDATDIRTESPQHYLQSYYGYCYNGGTANITSTLDEPNGVLGWKVPYDQTTADAVKNADLLWSPTRSPVSYIHENTTANHGVISIPYSHAMCELTVVLKATTGYSTVTAPFIGTEVIVNGVNKECTVTAPIVQITGATKGTETGKIGEVSLYGNTYTSGNTRTFYAIFVPGTKIKEGDALLNINDVDGNNYTLTVTSSMLTNAQWGSGHSPSQDTDGKNYILSQSGNNYKIEVTVTKQEISAVSTLADWVTVETTGTGDIQFTNDDDELLFEDDSNDGRPGDVTVHAVDKNKFKNNSSFSLFDLKATDANREASVRTDNDLYDFVTISTFNNPDDNDTFDDVWVNNPDIYWPNATDNYYFRALAKYNGSTGTGDNKINDISSVGSMTGTVSKGTAVSQGTIAEGHDIIWGTTAKHYGKGKNYGSDPTDLRTYEAGQAIPPRTGDVPIAFEHIMSKITFNLATSTGDPTPASAVNLTSAKIYITNLYTSGTVTLDNGNITYTDTNMNSSTELSGAAIKDFYAANEVDGEKTYRLNEYMVIPQPLTDASLVYIVLADGTTYKMILKNCKYQVGEDADHNPRYEDISKWERGKHYVYTITLEKEKITFRALIKDWEPVKEGSGNATLEWD